MATQVTHDPSGIAVQLFQGLAHVLELFGMGLAADLQRQPWRKARIKTAAVPPRPLAQGRQVDPAPARKAGRPSDERCSLLSRSCPPPHASRCPHRQHQISVRPGSSGSAAIRHPLPRSAHANGSGTLGQSAACAEKMSRQ